MKRITKKLVKKAAKNLSNQIIDFIDEMAYALPALFQDPYNFNKHFGRRFSDFERRLIDQTLYRLRNRNLIKTKRIGKYVIHTLTLEGQQKRLVSVIKLKMHKSKHNESCVVIFDIPEEKAKHRRFVRKLLLNNGFINLQRSVMIGPMFPPKEFYDLMEQLKIRQNVTIISGRVLYSLS